MVGSHTACVLPVSSTYQPNGPDSTNCLALLSTNPTFELSLRRNIAAAGNIARADEPGIDQLCAIPCPFV